MKKLLCLLMIPLNFLSSDLCIKSIKSITKQYPDVKYIQIEEQELFEYKPFPISKFPELQPYSGFLNSKNIIIIPNGEIFSPTGYLKIKNNIIAESMWENERSWQINSLQLESKKLTTSPLFIKGTVASIAQPSSSCYYIWLTQVLDRLRILQKSGVAYDWIYTSLDQPFMKESLKLLDINLEKIINAAEHNHIQAETVIGFSAPTRKNLQKNKLFCNHKNLASYCSNQHIKYLQSTLLPQASFVSKKFGQKIFISRKDSHNGRHIQNEDEIFTLFKQNGFEKYCLTELSMIEQIALFNNAKIIVAAHGAALANLIFCKPKTKILEIFQARSSCTYWYMAQQLNLNYHYLKTLEFNEANVVGGINTKIPLSLFKMFIEENQDFLKIE